MVKLDSADSQWRATFYKWITVCEVSRTDDLPLYSRKVE